MLKLPSIFMNGELRIMVKLPNSGLISRDKLKDINKISKLKNASNNNKLVRIRIYSE